MSILNNCFSKTSASPATFNPDDRCLKKSVDTLLETYSTSELMSYIVASTAPYAIISNCHDVAHVIGQETFIKSGNMEVALNQCSGKCNYGCTHGVIAAGVAKSFGAKYLDEDIAHANLAMIEQLGAKYCFPHSLLCHPIGHVLYIKTQDIESALQSCEKIAEGTSIEPCYGGVFMEAAGGTDVFIKSATPSDRKDNDYAYPCNAVSPQYRHACFQYLPNFQKQLFAKNEVSLDAQFGIMRDVCQSFPDTKYRSDCFFGIGYLFIRPIPDTTKPNLRDPALCDTLSGIDQDSCIVGVAFMGALSERRQYALNYCNARSDKRQVVLCYNVMFQTMKDYNVIDETILAECDSSNSPDACRKQHAAYLRIAETLPQYFLEGLF